MSENLCCSEAPSLLILSLKHLLLVFPLFPLKNIRKYYISAEQKPFLIAKFPLKNPEKG